MIRIGLVGIGHLGRIHLQVLQDLPAHFELVGIYDHNQERLAALKFEASKLRIFSSYEELLEHTDAVGIIASTPAHFELAALAIKSEKAVFIEKPICANLAEALQLKTLTEIHQVLVQVGHVERFNPFISALTPHLKGQTLQHMHSNRSAPFQQRGAEVSVVLDLMIHDLDLLLNWNPVAVVKLEVEAKQEQTEHPDEVRAKLSFSNGMRAELFASRIAVQRIRTIALTCSHETYHLDLIKPESTIQSASGELSNIQVIPQNALQQQWLEFAQCFEQQSVPSVDIKAGISALQLALDIEALAKSYISQNSISSIQ